MIEQLNTLFKWGHAIGATGIAIAAAIGFAYITSVLTERPKNYLLEATIKTAILSTIYQLTICALEVLAKTLGGK